MALPPNPKLDSDILVAARSSDQAAIAYAMLRVATAIDTLDGNGPKLIEALNEIARNIDEASRRIASAISNQSSGT